MQKKKAFTLTELLVVVVIIGTLAVVVLPKFTQVLEGRRTTEAENIMRAVRSEQEARCTLGKNYTGTATDLASWPQNQGSNYTYVLGATGMEAQSRNKKYTLSMPSYKDGSICCVGKDGGNDCGTLGKSYRPCLVEVPDEDTECAAEGVSMSASGGAAACTDGDKKNVVGATGCVVEEGEQCVSGTWTHYTVDHTTDCNRGCEEPLSEGPCPSGTGTRTRGVTCNTSTGQWITTEWDESGCSAGSGCSLPAKPDAPCSTVKGGEWKGDVHYTVNADCTGYDMDDSECTCNLGFHEPDLENIPGRPNCWRRYKYNKDEANCDWVKAEPEEVCAECTWQRSSALVSCRIAYDTYCQLLAQGKNEEDILGVACAGKADYFTTDGCGMRMPTGEEETCLSLEMHEPWPACQNGAPLGGAGTVTIQAREYTAKCVMPLN